MQRDGAYLDTIAGPCAEQRQAYLDTHTCQHTLIHTHVRAQRLNGLERIHLLG
jgi:hypothetical protein